MNSMQAVVIDATGGSDVLHLSEVPRPARVNAEFLIKVVAAGVKGVTSVKNNIAVK